MPLGIPNWCHVARYFPSWSKIWIRVLDRSHTNRRPRLSMAMQCAVRNSPGAYPVFPQALMNFPSFAYFTMRLFDRGAPREKNPPLGRRAAPGGRAKLILTAPRHSGLAERHQHGSVGAEL